MGFNEFFNYPAETPDAVDLDDPSGPVLGGSWTPERWTLLLSFTDLLRLRAGEYLIHKGEVEKAIYIVQEGQLEVLIGARGGARRFPMEEGTVLGEVAFFDGRPRSADVTALVDSHVRRLSAEAWETMSARHPELGRALITELGKILAHRLRRAEVLART